MKFLYTCSGHFSPGWVKALLFPCIPQLFLNFVVGEITGISVRSGTLFIGVFTFIHLAFHGIYIVGKMNS